MIRENHNGVDRKWPGVASRAGHPEVPTAWTALAAELDGWPLGLDLATVNVNDGAVAIGHPIGASGARVLVTLIHEMVRRDAKKGVAALCLGGGNSVALAIER